MSVRGKYPVMSLIVITLVLMGCTGDDGSAKDNENGNGNGNADENESPHASMWFPKSVTVGQSVRFDASNSSDPDGVITEYFWDFGDGGNATGKIVHHTFERASYLRILLRVTDDNGGQDTRSDYISIKEDADNETMTAPGADLTPRKIEKIPGITKYIVTVSNVTGNNTEIINMNYSIIDRDSKEILGNGSLVEASQGSATGVVFATFDDYLTDGDLFTISPENIPGVDDGDLFRIDFIPNGEIVGSCLLGAGE